MMFVIITTIAQNGAVPWSFHLQSANRANALIIRRPMADAQVFSSFQHGDILEEVG
ncbi:MAG: hypothetical protein KC588_18430 [Nitrospira sp.]|nr:hypothetical protein [Nitrospira sp.]